MIMLKNSFIAFCLILASYSTVFACPEPIELTVAKASVVTLDDAVQQVKASDKGKVLDAQTIEADGQAIHVIKVLTPKGVVKKIHVPAKK